MGGRYDNTPPPYYSGGYTQGPAYASFSRPQNPSTMPPLSLGWGESNVFTPPMGQNQPGPSQQNNEAMDINEPAPTQQNQTCQMHSRTIHPNLKGLQGHHNLDLCYMKNKSNDQCITLVRPPPYSPREKERNKKLRQRLQSRNMRTIQSS
jgi:hypothetical protein